MWKLFSRTKDKLPAGRTTEEADDLIRRYSTAILREDAPLIRDESWLPASKAELKEALSVGLATSQDEQDREELRWLFTDLAHFQPGIGDIPIDTRRRVEDFDRFSAVADKWDADYKQLKIELAAIENVLKKRGCY
jgi:hypothetical protein